MMTMAKKNRKVELRVEDVERADLAKGVARINQATMKLLQILDEDAVEIIGSKMTVAKVYPTDPKDNNKNIIRIDAYIRRNAGTVVGGHVIVCKTNVVEAKSIVLAPVSMQFTVDDFLVNFLKNTLFGKPLIKNNIVAVVMLAQPVQFIVVDTKPDGPVRISDNTKLQVLCKLDENSG